MAEPREDGCDANIQLVNSEYTQQWGATREAFSVWSIRGQRQCCRIHRATGTYEWAIPVDGSYDLAKAEATLRINERWVEQNECSMQMMRTLKAKFEASLHSIDARIAALQEEDDAESDGNEELKKIRDLPMEVGVVGPRCGEGETAAPRRIARIASAPGAQDENSSDSGDDGSGSSSLDLGFLDGGNSPPTQSKRRGKKRKNPPVDPFADAQRLRLSLEKAASQKQSQGSALLAPPPAEPTSPSPSSPPQPQRPPSPPTQIPDTLPAAPATQLAAPIPAVPAERKRPTKTVVPAPPTLQIKSPAAPLATAPSAPALSSPAASPLSSPSAPELASPAASPVSPAVRADGDAVLASPVSPAQQATNLASAFPADLPSPSNPAIPSPDLGSGGAPAASASDEADSPLDLSFLDGGDGDGDGDEFA